MPNRDQHLDSRLDAERRDVLGRILMPEIGEIRVRARAVRRRRHAVAVGVAAVCLGILGTGAAVIPPDRTPDKHLGAAPTPSFQGWHGSGLTVLALTAKVLDLPGPLYDVEFADRQVGYALSRDCAGDTCELGFAITRDGGETWSTGVPLPESSAASAVEAGLVPIASAGVGFVLGDRSWFLREGAPSWTAHDATAATTTIAALPKGARLWQGRQDGCTPGPVEAWLADGTRRRLASQPAMAVCRVAPAPAGDGAWWVSGMSTTVDGKAAAVGVTRDDGRTWTITRLGGPDEWAQVSTLGAEVYAAVVTPDGTAKFPETLSVRAVFRSVSQGAFTRYGGNIGVVVGDLVPLLDGRLVTAGPGWLIAAGRESPLVQAGGTLPWVQRIVRTPGFWVAFDLFENGWAAVSVDGVIWQKINLR